MERMQQAHAATERAEIGWPFPDCADSIARAIVESYAPITREFEADIAAAKEGIANAAAERDTILEQLHAANARVAIAQAAYQGVIRRLNEWRIALAKAKGQP